MKKIVMLGAMLGCAGTAWPAVADETAPSTAPASPAPTAMTNPTMAGQLAANPNPAKFDAGPVGSIYVTGAITGLLMHTDSNFASEHSDNYDLSNAQVILQKTDGPLQFFVQTGIYSVPSIGSPYIRSSDAHEVFWDPVPLAWGKWVVDDALSVQFGKLPTLIGAEYTFTFENINIERGLLWNQEPAISKGGQINYTMGPIATSLSFTDGFDSDSYNWVTGSATWTIDTSNSLSVVAGGNAGKTTLNSLRTPLPQSNSTIVNLIYTYNAAPWTITPYFQYTIVPKDRSLGFGDDAQTYGAALLADYAFTDHFNLGARAEVIGSSGKAVNGAPNLLYGNGSTAWSMTLTPTYQQDLFFLRGEVSFVQASHTTPGDAFGKDGNARNQTRVVLETGWIF